MTATRITVDAEDMERIAHHHGLSIDIDTAANTGHLKLDGIEFVAHLPVAGLAVAAGVGA